MLLENSDTDSFFNPMRVDLKANDSSCSHHSVSNQHFKTRVTAATSRHTTVRSNFVKGVNFSVCRKKMQTKIATVQGSLNLKISRSHYKKGGLIHYTILLKYEFYSSRPYCLLVHCGGGEGRGINLGSCAAQRLVTVVTKVSTLFCSRNFDATHDKCLHYSFSMTYMEPQSLEHRSSDS